MSLGAFCISTFPSEYLYDDNCRKLSTLMEFNDCFGPRRWRRIISYPKIHDLNYIYEIPVFISVDCCHKIPKSECIRNNRSVLLTFSGSRNSKIHYPTSAHFLAYTVFFLLIWIRSGVSFIGELTPIMKAFILMTSLRFENPPPQAVMGFGSSYLCM